MTPRSRSPKIASRFSRLLPVLLVCFTVTDAIGGQNVANSPREEQPSVGTVVTQVTQRQSPAVIQEFSVSIQNGGKGIILNRVLLRSTGTAAVGALRIGWVTIFTDKQKAPETHVGQLLNLAIPIQPHNKKRYIENLLPVIPLEPSVKTISFFIADVNLQDGQSFHEDKAKVASEERDRVFAQ